MPKFNDKTTDKKTIAVEGELVKNSNPSKAPAWFVAFSKDLNSRLDDKFNRIDKRFDNLETRIDNLENRFDNLETRLDNLVSKNNLTE